MAALPQFHSRTGTLVTLSNDNRTARRNHPTQEFNNGVILGADPLKDGQIFEVRIDKKVIFFLTQSLTQPHSFVNRSVNVCSRLLSSTRLSDVNFTINYHCRIKTKNKAWVF